MQDRLFGRTGLPSALLFTRWLGAGALALIATSLPLTHATTVWTGPLITFTKPANSDYAMSINQDRLTALVWLTRADTMGLFNIKSESGYTHNLSPADTEWAYGTLADHATLSYRPWEIWNRTNPPAMVGAPAVLHLISEDIYLSVKFTGWGQGLGGGMFAYERSTPAIVPPATIVISQPVISSNQFKFRYNAELGLSYVVQNSSNLMTWLPVATNVAASNPVDFTHNIISNGPWFYRVGRPPGP